MGLNRLPSSGVRRWFGYRGGGRSTNTTEHPAAEGPEQQPKVLSEPSPVRPFELGELNDHLHARLPYVQGTVCPARWVAV